MRLVDSHCHIHASGYALDADRVVQEAAAAGVTKCIVIGTDASDSQRAVAFAQSHRNVWAAVALHPHDARFSSQLDVIRQLSREDRVVAIGECGLDYHYRHSSPTVQQRVLRQQIELALECDLPLSFHVREAFTDFWSILDDYPDVRGVVHSFTAGPSEVEAALSRGLYLGLNGIGTFTKDKEQLLALKQIPLAKIVLETDAPFLTPAPLRGKVNQPKYVGLVAEFLSQLRQEQLAVVAETTSRNAEDLFGVI